MPVVRPAVVNWFNFPILQGFKWSRSNTTAHSGIDLSMPPGSMIAAPMPGTIVSSGKHAWGGQVDEQVTIAGQPYVLSWLHLSGETVRPGQQVQAGQLLGYSGSAPAGYYSGPPSAANHTHFEVTHGTVPPYTGYNPHNPTSQSYPVSGAWLLTAWQLADPTNAGSGPPGVNGFAGLAGAQAMLNEQGQASGPCAHSISIPYPGGTGTICLDAGLDVLIRGTLILGGIVLVVMAFVLLALGNPEVQTAGKQAGGKVAEAIGLGL